MIEPQEDLSNESLSELLKPYLDRYPTASDEPLAELICKCCFSRSDVETVADWKFQGNAVQRAQARANLDKNADFVFEDLTSRAFKCTDDLAALLLVEQLTGVGKAFGSAILTAQDPCHFSVYDYRAGRALQAIGYLNDLPMPTSEGVELPWLRFLAAVRDVSARTGWTLRNTDRALWKAGG